MTDEINKEILEILLKMKEQITNLEYTVYNKDNLLMKAGLVQAITPSPKVNQNTSGMPDSDMINKMDWDQLNNLAAKITGE